MNVVASGAPAEILGASTGRALVCPRVEREALWVEGDEPGSRVPVDIEALVRAGAVERTSPSLDELARFVELAREVDDGEAQALAIAQMRHLTLASDDRKAGRVARDLGVRVIGTPELVNGWAQSGVAGDRVADAIRRIEARAHFAPSPSHKLARQWVRLRDG